MGKKKNKKSKKNKDLRLRSMLGGTKTEKGEKVSKKGKKVLKRGQHLDSSLSKKQARKLSRFAKRYPEVPDKISEIRSKCNHACDVMTVEEFMEMPNHFSTTLDLMRDALGESNLMICKDCFEPLVGNDIANEANLKVAIATLIGVINYITPRVKMSNKELQKHYAQKTKLLDLLATLQDELDEAYKKDASIEEADRYREQRQRERQNRDKSGHGGNSPTKLGGNSHTTFADSDDDSDEDEG